MSVKPIQNYDIANILQSEIMRNRAGCDVFARFLTLAYGKPVKVFISHHIGYDMPVAPGMPEHPIEVPSADTLLFSRELMGKVFGDMATTVMHALMLCDPQKREVHLERELEMLQNHRDLIAKQELMRRPFMLGDALDQAEHEAGKV